MVARKNITWKTSGGKAPARAQRHRPYAPDTTVRWAAPEELPAYLMVGALFRAEHTLGRDNDDNWIGADYTYVVPTWPKDAVLPTGGICVYAGMARVEEIRNGTITRLQRHTIIVGAGRYIITNLNWISPVK